MTESSPAYAAGRTAPYERWRMWTRSALTNLRMMGGPRWPGARAVAADVALALGLLCFTAGSLHWWNGSQQGAPRTSAGLAYVLVLIACGPVAGRRVWPPAALAVTLVATAVYVLAGYPYGPIFGATVIGVCTLAVSVGGWQSLVGPGLAAAVLLGAEAPRSATSGWLAWSQHALSWCVLLLAAWALGTIVRVRHESIARSRQEEARRQAYEQRLEIAREVHDVVGHGLAVINMQASVALHVRERRPEQAEMALETIRQASKDSLEQLRRTLAVFREDGDGGAARAPNPGLAELPALVSTMEASGLSLDVEISGARRPLPAAVDLAAYRILQESLTNVLRHAGATAARVRLAYSPRHLEVEVTNSDGGQSRAPSRSPGHGIAGMRERASTLGGLLEAGPVPGGGFRVRAELPLAASR